MSHPSLLHLPVKERAQSEQAKAASQKAIALQAFAEEVRQSSDLFPARFCNSASLSLKLKAMRLTEPTHRLTDCEGLGCNSTEQKHG